jgi:UDP-N-acetyl-D-mannosaminuronic acid transferase (WecB/TagA/CpsF family)
VHGVMEARHEEEFGRILNGASLVVPNGYPLVVLGPRQGGICAGETRVRAGVDGGVL